MGFEQRLEVARLADQHLAADNRLNAILRRAVARQDSLAGEAKREDLPAPRSIRFVFGQDARAHEHDFVARRARLAEWAPWLHLHGPVRHLVEAGGETGLQPRRDQ